MSFDITIQHDLKKLMQSLNALETKVAPQATVRTLNRVAESAKVASAKHIASQMNSTQASVKRRIETRKATFKTLWATLVARDRALQLIELDPIFCDVIVKRWEEFTGNNAMLASDPKGGASQKKTFSQIAAKRKEII